MKTLFENETREKLGNIYRGDCNVVDTVFILKFSNFIGFL